MVGCQEIIKTNNNIKKSIENQQKTKLSVFAPHFSVYVLF